MKKIKAPVMDTGINIKNREKIVEGLSYFLSDTFSLYMKTHNFHWNVTGPMFNTLHLMFEEQYNELWLATDLIAERIRALGFPVDSAFLTPPKRSTAKTVASVPKAEEMIRLLVEGNEAAARTARKYYPLAEKAGDEVTADLLTQRLQVHEKTAWMLRSLLEA